ncbi:hypothetical protein QRD90_06965 [Peribacillus frigoritolerans]|uniref:hypothetical protein n=1 Tax=Peribacillus frigoritolerans TaxID=450367 RepID=UPI00256FD5A3|nr:hypothetical protein [Peribacillus frigoritolerans]WJE48933.1 hypothetical protein QRD90_06965 [Peribacillus frigoritolerans]
MKTNTENNTSLHQENNGDARPENEKGNSLYKNLLIGISGFLFFPIVLNLIITRFNLPWEYVGEAEDWLGFFSNYAGAFIGALVALIIAKNQTKEQRTQFKESMENAERDNRERIEQLKQAEIEKEARQRKINQLPALVFLKYEAKQIHNRLDHLERQKTTHFHLTHMKKFDKLKEKRIIEDFLKEKRQLIPLNKQCHFYISLIEDIDLHVELVECFNFYSVFSLSLSHDPIEARNEKENLLEKMIELAKLGDLDESSRKFKEELKKPSELIWAITEKLLFWDELEQQKYTDRFQEIINRIDEEIQKTKELKNQL